jgi:signal transduction histidine kinase
VHDRPAEHLNVLEGALSLHSPLDAVVSIVSIPLRLDGRPLGLLGIGASRPLAFSEEEHVFLQALGQEAALAIRNARLYERERDQVAQLQALDELQDGFISGVSHELRTPLTCIKTSVDLLQSTSHALTGTQVELIETVQHHLGRLEAFVGELVEMTRLEAGRVTLSLQPTDLSWLAAGVVEALRPLSDRRQQTIRLEFPETLSLVAVDRRRIEQVLTNLLSNAIKFTPRRAAITLGVREMADRIDVWVADSGPGIPARDRERIFEKFYGAPDGRGQSGLGLGLYLARELVELHGGRIWVEGSDRGQAGSTFRFALPKPPKEDGI